MRTTAIAMLATAALLSGCASNGPNRSAFEPTFPLAEHEPTLLDGNWFNEPFGIVVSVSALDFAIYRRVGPLCWRVGVPEIVDEYRRALAEFSIVSDKSEIYFRADRSAPEQRYSNLVDLPEACTQSLSRNDVRNAFRLHLDRQYPYFAKRGVNWQSRKLTLDAATGPIESDDELHASLIAMIDGLADPLLALRRDGEWWRDPAAVGVTFERLDAAFARQNEIADPGAYRELWYGIVNREATRWLAMPEVALDGALLRGRTPLGAGFVRIRDLAGASPGDWRDALNQTWRSFDDVPAIIVDLTMASGGRHDNAIAVASALSRDEDVLWRSSLNMPGEPDWLDQRRTDRSRRPAVPMYVLTSDVTSGAAERVVLALRGQPAVRQVGSATRGSMARAMLVSLPNDWALQLPAITIANRNDTDFEGVGLAPDFGLEFFPENQLSLAHVRALETLDGLIAENLLD